MHLCSLLMFGLFRHYFLKESNIFIPEPGHEKSIVAVSALARAMKELDYAAVVRCVWRQGQTNVVLGVLLPFVSTQDNVVSMTSSCFVLMCYND